jgi:VWFA-related protein
VNCEVSSPGGGALAGLARDDFRVFQDGAEQRIEHFDAAAEGASVVLVIDASPSVTRDLEEMKRAARSFAEQLAPAGEMAIVAFERDTFRLAPFSRDRELLERAIENVGIIRNPAVHSESNIYRAVYLVAQQLFAGRSGRKAIVLLTDGQDSGLGLTWESRALSASAGLQFEDVLRALSAGGIAAYVISTQSRPKIMSPAWLAQNQRTPMVTEETRKAGVPHYTAYLAEMVRAAGGRWHTLRVELPGHGDAQIHHRVAYYAARGS